MKKELCELHDYSEVLYILDKISIFGGLTRKQLGVIFKELKKVSIKKDEVIFNQGASPDDIYIIQRGRVKIVEELSSDSLEIISFTTGDCFGETELIGIFPYIASAVAINVFEVVITSSPCFIPFATSARCRAEVPELRATACFLLQ